MGLGDVINTIVKYDPLAPHSSGNSNAAQVAAYWAKAAALAGGGAPDGPPRPFPQQPVGPNQSPLGGSHPFATRATTQFVQAQLKHMGYNIGIDGVAGPMTASAYK